MKKLKNIEFKANLVKKSLLNRDEQVQKANNYHQKVGLFVKLLRKIKVIINYFVNITNKNITCFNDEIYFNKFNKFLILTIYIFFMTICQNKNI